LLQPRFHSDTLMRSAPTTDYREIIVLMDGAESLDDGLANAAATLAADIFPQAAGGETRRARQRNGAAGSDSTNAPAVVVHSAGASVRFSIWWKTWTGRTTAARSAAR
jgi:hypothetical protein